jgi:hypothetical protein
MKLLKAFCFLAVIFITACSILVPIVHHEWYVITGSIVWLVVIIAYGEAIGNWTTSFMEEEPETKPPRVR